MNNQTIQFNYNWNNKLNCNSFSTVRIQNPNKYKVGEIYNIILSNKNGKQNVNYGFAKIMAITDFYLEKVTPAMAFLDTNYSQEQFINLVKTMYKNSQIDFTKKKMSFIVLQKTN